MTTPMFVTAELLGPDVFLFGLLGLLGLIVEIWALANNLRRPASAFEAANVNRTLWLVLLILAMFACGFGLILSVLYLVLVDSKVKQAQALGSNTADERP